RGEVQGVPRPDGRARRDGPLDREVFQARRPDDLAAGEVCRGDAGHLDVRSTGYPIDEHGGAGRLVAIFEELVVDLVRDVEVLILVEKDVAHDDVSEVEPGLFERGLDVLHRLADLLLEGRRMAAAWELVPLARDIERVARQDARAERQASGRIADPPLFGEVH